MRLLLPLFLAASLALPASAAINPAEFIGDAPDQMRLREIARVVHEADVDGARLRRVTLVGEVVEQKNATAPRLGQTVVIDFTVDLTERARAAEAHRKAHATRPGPQFMHEPDPPQTGADGTYWANVAQAASSRAGANREAGVVADAEGHRYRGPVFVPASGQYSFDEPR